MNNPISPQRIVKSVKNLSSIRPDKSASAPKVMQHAALFDILNIDNLVVIGEVLKNKGTKEEQLDILKRIFISMHGQGKRKLIRWNDSPIASRVLCFATVMKQHEHNCYSFSLNFGDKTLKRMRQTASHKSKSKKPQTATHILSERLKRYFRSEAGFTPEFWFVVETTVSTKRIHIHGNFLARDDDQLILINKALERAGDGYRQRFNNKTVDVQSSYGKISWAAYATKDIDLAHSHLNDIGVGVGNGYFCTFKAKNKGKLIYEELRKLLSLKTDL